MIGQPIDESGMSLDENIDKGTPVWNNGHWAADDPVTSILRIATAVVGGSS